MTNVLTVKDILQYPFEMAERDSVENLDWETICNRCGLCCFEKIENDSGTIFFTRTPCRYLDIVSRECKVYERRFAINPGCVQLTPDLVRGIRWLHDDCGYRKALKLKRGKTKIKM